MIYKAKKLETVTGKVGRIIYRNINTEYKVLSLIREKDRPLTISGNFPELVEGSRLEVHGNYKTHEKYGRQFIVTSFNFTHTKDVDSVSLYLQSIAKWLGPVRSAAIAHAFGDRIQDILENTPDQLLSVPGIGKTVVESLVESWSLNKHLKDIKIFLLGLGLSEKRTKRILTRYGIETQNVLTENPWLLIQDDFAFSACDSIAQKLGLPPDSPLRYEQYIVYQLKESLSSGHLYLSHAEILSALNKYNVKSTFPFNNIGVTAEDLDPHLATVIDKGTVVKDGGNDRYYGSRSYYFENESARLLTALLATPSSCNLDTVNVEGYIHTYESMEKITLSQEQADAIRYFVTEKALVITGAPGTGKTTILKAFVRIMEKSDINFELLCPTGIATKKLEKTVGSAAHTIHRRFGYNGFEWTFNNERKYETQIIIVDEMSMVDMEVFYRLVSAITPATKLVFVGDVYQLPSVGPGNVLRELIGSGAIKTVTLEKIHRQEETSDIIKVASKIKDGDTDLSMFKPTPKADVFFIEAKSTDKIRELIIDLAVTLKNKGVTVSDGVDRHFQIISPRNTGPLSVDDLNTALQNKLNPLGHRKEIQIPGGVLRQGDRVIIKKNDYQLGIYNGDIGKVLEITPQVIVVELEVYKGVGPKIDIPTENINDLIKLAYAITAHRSQGAEYPYVILPFVKQHGRNMLQRNLLYTAITRAKTKVIVLGHREAIITAIQNDSIQKRNTVFSERIVLWGQNNTPGISQILSTNGSGTTSQTSLSRLRESREERRLEPQS